MNKTSYTHTNIVEPQIILSADFIELVSQGHCGITDEQSLQLSDTIGLQRKGSGDAKAKSNLQFKLRGNLRKKLWDYFNASNSQSSIGIQIPKY